MQLSSWLPELRTLYSRRDPDIPQSCCSINPASPTALSNARRPPATLQGHWRRSRSWQITSHLFAVCVSTSTTRCVATGEHRPVALAPGGIFCRCRRRRRRGPVWTETGRRTTQREPASALLATGRPGGGAFDRCQRARHVELINRRGAECYRRPSSFRTNQMTL